MSGFSFRLTTLPAKFGCGSAAPTRLRLRLDERESAGVPIGPHRRWRPVGIHRANSMVYGQGLRSMSRKGRFSGAFHSESAGKARHAVTDRRLGGLAGMSRTSRRWPDRTGQERPIGAVVRLPRAKAAVSAARTLPNLGGISDTCPLPSRFFPIIPIFSS